MKKISILLSTFLSLLLLNGCGTQNQNDIIEIENVSAAEIQVDEAPQEKPSIPAEIFNNNIFSIEIPKGWKATEEMDGETFKITFTSSTYEPDALSVLPKNGGILKVEITEPNAPQGIDKYKADRLANPIPGFVLYPDELKEDTANGQRILLSKYTTDTYPLNKPKLPFLYIADLFDEKNDRRYTLTYAFDKDGKSYEQYFDLFWKTILPLSNWNFYDNKEEGYSLKYPSHLNPVAKENGVRLEGKSDKPEKVAYDLTISYKDEAAESKNSIQANQKIHEDNQRIYLMTAEGDFAEEDFDEIFGSLEIDPNYLSVKCEGQRISNISDLPIETIDEYADVYNFLYSLKDEGRERLYEGKSLRYGSCHDLNQDGNEELFAIISATLKDVKKESYYSELPPLELMAFLNWDGSGWNLIMADESRRYDDNDTSYQFEAEPFQNGLRVRKESGEYFLTLNKDQSPLIDFFDKDNSGNESLTPLVQEFGKEQIDQLNITNTSEKYILSPFYGENGSYGEYGIRLFKQENNQLYFLGALPSITRKSYTITGVLEKQNGDNLILSTFVPETESPLGNLLRFEIKPFPHSRIEPLKISEGFGSHDFQVSPDKTKILSSSFAEEGNQLVSGGLVLFDLQRDMIKTIVSYQSRDGLTLSSGPGMMGHYADFKWLDDKTIEYKVYKVIQGDPKDEYSSPIFELFETKTHTIQ